MDVRMPEYVDSQIQILWFELDEFMIFAILAFVGLIAKMLITLIVVGLVVQPIIKRLKAGSVEGAVFHSLCGFGLISLNKEFVDLTKKEYFY